MPITLKPTPYDDDLAQQLVAELMSDLSDRYGTASGDDTPVRAVEFDGPDGDFFVAYAAGEAVGCVGIRRHDGSTVEMKRLFVRPRYRGFGYGKAMVRAVEESARTHGYERVILETGHSQPEACSLYEAQGYSRIENYGFYAAYDDCRCYGKAL